MAIILESNQQIEYLNQAIPIVRNALAEDIGDRDITTEELLSSDVVLAGELIAKQPGVAAGMEVAKLTFRILDERVRFDAKVSDGGAIACGQVLATISGSGRALLGGERVALNFLQRMCGIATLTKKYVEAVRGTAAIILDTRKTMPGLRILDKWAVRAGGGQNHRQGLYDAVLIKENHITSVGSISDAIKRMRNKAPSDFVEVEVKNLEELREAISLKVDRVLLDNMKPDDLREAVRISGGRVPLEASGNVTLENVAEIAKTGVHYISIGSLTHSAKALDISFLIDSNPRTIR
ncbi:MAG: carboxylating nicotinate-nucleotide diphosphorylase [bacterium]